MLGKESLLTYFMGELMSRYPPGFPDTIWNQARNAVNSTILILI